MIETTIIQRVYKGISNKYPYIAKHKDEDFYVLFYEMNKCIILKNSENMFDYNISVGTLVPMCEDNYIPFKDELIIKNK